MAAAAAGMSEGERRHPLHRLVWDNRYQELDEALKKKEHDAEEVDPRGRYGGHCHWELLLLVDD